ncbi:MAG: hypothetical protein EOM67_03220 [Spirochaetia bacterium]|nr:hypothetical protein [Spirochaetia bacterium]
MSVDNFGTKFWARVDTLRDNDTSLMQLALEAGLNYDVIKVQYSLQRIPNSQEVCLLANALQIPPEWLVLGVVHNTLDTIRVENTLRNRRILSIVEKLVGSRKEVFDSIELIVHTETEA